MNIERIVVVFAAISVYVTFGGSPTKPPNILFILADDYGWNDVGYHGSEIKTPNLDSLALKGVKLENYYVQPICSPSRSQLMTGRYQIHTGLQHFVIRSYQPNGLPLHFPTLADMLRAQGYATHIVGKWHLGFYKKEFMPTSRGFDSHFGYLTGMEDYFTHVRCEEFNDDKSASNPTYCGLDFRHNMEPVRTENGSYSAHVFTRHAVNLVKSHARYNSDQPLFMYLPYQSVHAPLQVPNQYVKHYAHIKDRNRRTYAGMVAALDEAVGNVTKAFKQYGLWENTILVFSTDNGGQTGAGGNNWPLRGMKNQLWEGGVRGVGFLSGPLLPNPGSTVRELMHVSDWFPTLVHLAGGNTTDMDLDSHDVWRTISHGKPSPRKELLHNIDPLTKLSGQRWTNSSFDNRVRAALRRGDWKILTGAPGKGRWTPPPHLSEIEVEPENAGFTADEDSDKNVQNVWLFNVKEDPLEKKDLSHVYPDKVLSMLERLSEYNKTAVPCHFPPPDPQANPLLHGGVWQPWRK